MRLASIVFIGLVLCGAILFAQLSSPTKEDPRRADRIRRNVAMGMNRVIKGRVLLDDGKPAEGFVVNARFKMHQTGAPGEGDAVTDAKGYYEIQGLGKDEFYVSVAHSEKPYVIPPGTLVDLTATTSATLPDILLRLGPEVTIRVKDAETGEPVKGLSVTWNYMAMGDHQPPKTDANGEARFRVGYLEFGLRVEDENRNDGYGQAPGYPLSKGVKLATVQPVTWDLLVYKNFIQPRPAVFRGVVEDLDGNPVAGANVRMQRYNDSLRTVTDKAGRFEFKTFRIQFHEDPERGAAVMAQKGDARAFKVVSAKETWGTIRVTLGTEPRGIVKGRVVDQHGRPLDGCRIHYWETFGIAIGSVGPSATQYTRPDGTFQLTELHPRANYSFSFGSFYEHDQKRLGIVRVPNGNRDYVLTSEGLDLGTITVPTAEHTVEGTIVDTAGRPVTKEVSLNLKGAFTDLSAYPDEQGRFKFEGVVDEPLTLWVFGGINGGYRTGPDSPDLFLKKSVQPNQRNLRLQVKLRPVKP
ncbi:MAG: collagen binding domain-containing protein [Fimbriimonas sp.]